MITVHKYILLPVADVVEIRTRVGAEILTVGLQANAPMLWARVDTDAPEQVRRIRIAGTGHADASGDYIGTLLIDGGQLVFHFFDLGPA